MAQHLRRRQVVVAALAATAPLARASAQAWPDRPIRLLAGVPAGSPTDIAARLLADRLGATRGWRLVVDNRPTANGMLAMDTVRRAPPDGYTLIFTASSTLTVLPHLSRNADWKPADFTPVIHIGATPIAITVAADSPLRSLADLIAAAKAKPDTIKAGLLPLTMSHFAQLMLDRAAGIALRPIPYTAQSQLLQSVLSRDVDVIFNGAGGVVAAVEGGQMRALAVTGEPIPALPGTPSAAADLPGFDASSWFGLFGPARMDAETVTLLNEAINAVLREPDMRAKLERTGAVVTGGPPGRLAAAAENDFARFGELVAREHLSAD